MAGKRMINSNVCESQKLNSVSFEAAELWFRLITVVDDNGNYYRDSLRVYANLMQEKNHCTQESTEKALRELSKIGLISVYKEDKREYLHLTDFEKHQNLRNDLSADVSYPLHPSTLGPAYTENGTRRDKCVRPQTEPEQDGTSRNVSALEVEVKEEDEVGGQSPVRQSFPDEETHQEGNFALFKKLFKSVAGVRVKDFKSRVEQYQELCRKFGEQEVLDAINAWVAQEGGKASTKRDNWAVKNFLDAVPEIIEEKKAAPEPDQEPEEIAKMPSGGPSLSKELML